MATSLLLQEWFPKLPDAMETMSGIIWLGLASGFISFVISEAKIFESLRAWVCRKNVFFGNLIHCPVCVGTWISLFLELIYQPNLFNKIILSDQILTGFVIAYISAIFSLILSKLVDVANK